MYFTFFTLNKNKIKKQNFRFLLAVTFLFVLNYET